jgi:phospholipase/lecithinase/hemolysin
VTHRFFPSTAIALGACIAGALIGVSSANAGPYSAEYVFGDSLSDTGNAAELFNEGFFYGTPTTPRMDITSETFRTRRAITTAKATGLSRFSFSRRAWGSTPIRPSG